MKNTVKSLYAASLQLVFVLNKLFTSPLLFTRLTSIIFFIFATSSLSVLLAQCIGSDLNYSGLFQVTFFSQSIETFIYNVGALISMPWTSISNDIVFTAQTGSSSSIANSISIFGFFSNFKGPK